MGKRYVLKFFVDHLFFETYTETTILNLLDEFDFDIKRFNDHLKDSQVVHNQTGNTLFSLKIHRPLRYDQKFERRIRTNNVERED